MKVDEGQMEYILLHINNCPHTYIFTSVIRLYVA